MSAGATVWGLPLTPLTRGEAVDRVDRLVQVGTPSYFITANLHYAMLTASTPGLDRVNRGADFILADGAPLVVASRRTSNPVPERVAGSDLIYDLCELAARRGYRVFLLGGPPGIAEEAARRLVVRYPRLQVAGTACPAASELQGTEVDALIDRIRSTRPDILFAALGQPKGEFWLSRHGEALGVPVSAQVGATLEFVAGRVRRAPRLFQKTGMEWAFRIYTDPKRLAPRYGRNALFLIRQIARDRLRRRHAGVPQSAGLGLAAGPIEGAEVNP
jgi:N-acetylglucosaminyldiphosphoundecaprenol N-acetyl-beta-D-mannosaminyltransferase